MAKYQLIFEGETLSGLIKNVKEELLVIEQQEEEAINHDRMMRTKVARTSRKNKPWSEFDVEFLIENYQLKKLTWVASALSRPVESVRAKLHNLRKINPNIKLINNRASKPVITKL